MATLTGSNGALFTGMELCLLGWLTIEKFGGQRTETQFVLTQVVSGEM